MISPFSKHASDHAGDAIAAEAGLVYRPLAELRGLMVRSRNVHLFAWGLGAFAVTLAVLHSSGQAGELRKSATIAGISGLASVCFYGLAALGAGLRTEWGRFLGMGISAVLLFQVAWYISSPSHWYWNSASAVMFARFAVAWVGLVSFVGTDQLFGSNRIGHAVLKDAVEYAREAQVQEANLLQMHAEGLREASRQDLPKRAA